MKGKTKFVSDIYGRAYCEALDCYVYMSKEPQPKKLIEEGFAREIGRRIQNMRKKAGLKKTDKIDLFIDMNPEIKDVKCGLMKK